MKFIFIVNGNARKRNSLQLVKDQLPNLREPIEYDIHETVGPKDALSFVQNYCKEHLEDDICFVACGGDGTINEVAFGMMGSKNKKLGVLAYGSGNDLIKYYPGKDFKSLQKLVDGTISRIDMLKATNKDTGEVRYSINVVNFGFDSVVCSKANEIKEKGGKNAYPKGVVHGILTGRFNKIDVELDGEKVTNGKLLLCTLANHKYVGGSYCCAPRSKNNDGLIEACLFTPIPLIKFMILMGPYQKGEHLEKAPAIVGNHMVYKQIKQAHVYSDKDFELCLDGEMFVGKDFLVDIIPSSLDFVVP